MPSLRARLLTLTLPFLTATALSPPARADEDDRLERMHFDVDYLRFALPVADSTFGAGQFPDHSGRELGFVKPTANMIDLRFAFLGRNNLGLVAEFGFGWGTSDEAGTDPFSQHVKGAFLALDYGVGIEGVVPLGDVLRLRGTMTTGPQIVMVPLDIQSGRSNSVAAVQWFLRPRLALEVSLSKLVSLGAFATDDVIRAQSWGAGAYVGFSLL